MYIVESVGPVFSVIVVGMILRRIEFLKEREVEVLNKTTFYVALPALILHSIINAEAGEIINMRLIIGMFMAMILMTVFVQFLSSAFHIDCHRKAVLMISTHRSNLAYLGIPILSSIFGDSVIGKIAVIVGLLSPGMYMLTILAVKLCSEKNNLGNIGKAGKNILVSVLKTPAVIGAVLGICISGLDLSLPTVFNETLRIVGNMALSVALFGVGASISLEHLKGDFPVIGLSVFLKLILLSVFGYIVFGWLGVNETDKAIGILLLAMPTATVVYVLASELDVDENLTASSIVATTITSIISIPVWLVVLREIGLMVI